jgi:hypothetical protein
MMELDYFPPQGTKYEWNPPSLRHKPWTSRLTFSDHHRFLVMYVSRNDKGLYLGWVDFRDLHYKNHIVRTRNFVDPLKALLATEKLAGKLVAQQNLPAWAEEALSKGWRPPLPF